MKNKLGCISLIIVLISILTRCSSCSYSEPDTTDHRKNIYTVKVTKISSDDYGDFMVKGETDAPNGSKILAQGESDKSENVASSINEDDYPQVKKHKFTAELDANDLTDDVVSKGQEIEVKIFAVKKYHIDYDDFKISKGIQKLIAKQVEPVILTVNSKIADYLKDDDDDSDNNSAADTDDSSDSDDPDDGDDPESDSDDNAINDEEGSDDTNSDEDTADDDDDDTDSTLSRSTAGMVYTRDSDKITADKATGKYHLPSQAGYYIKRENVETFNSEKDAIATGYVKSKR